MAVRLYSILSLHLCEAQLLPGISHAMTKNDTVVYFLQPKKASRHLPTLQRWVSEFYVPSHKLWCRTAPVVIIDSHFDGTVTKWHFVGASGLGQKAHIFTWRQKISVFGTWRKYFMIQSHDWVNITFLQLYEIIYKASCLPACLPACLTAGWLYMPPCLSQPKRRPSTVFFRHHCRLAGCLPFRLAGQPAIQ